MNVLNWKSDNENIEVQDDILETIENGDGEEVILKTVNDEKIKIFQDEKNKRNMEQKSRKSDKDWILKLDESMKYEHGELVYSAQIDRFGIFDRYCKKEGLAEILLFKIGSLSETMSRAWFLDVDKLKRAEKIGSELKIKN